jgi:hypothetical protein
MRELDVDVAWILETLPFDAVAFSLDGVDADAFRFAIEVRPFSVRAVVQAHYALLAATSHDTTGRILYVNPDAARPRPMQRAVRIGVPAGERDAARRRITERIADATRVHRLEDSALRRAEVERTLRSRYDDERRRGDIERWLEERYQADVPIAASLESGEFEVLEVAADPFPADKPKPARVLVIDRDESTADSLAAAPELTVVRAVDLWSALDEIARARFDLVLCAMRVGDWSAADALRMIASGHPEAARRIVFVAPAVVVGDAPPSVQRRSLLKPLDLADVRARIAELRGRA